MRPHLDFFTVHEDKARTSYLRNLPPKAPGLRELRVKKPLGCLVAVRSRLNPSSKDAFFALVALFLAPGAGILLSLR